MTKKNITTRLWAGGAVLSLALLTGCNPPSEGGSGAEELPGDQAALVELAKKEGSVSIGAGGHTQSQAQLLADEFEAEYGIEVDFVREASGKIAQKLEAQMSGGNVSFDVISLNDAASLQNWADEGVLADAKVPNAEDVMKPFNDGDAIYYPFTWAAMGYSYNSANTKTAEAPGTWDELAATEGTVAVADPGTSGAALTFAAVMDNVDADFFAKVGQGDALISSSALALTQMVAVGEAAYGVPGIEHAVATAQMAGEPLMMGYPEGELGALPSYMASLSSAANPAAARLLVQFAMSPEFQQTQAQEIGSRSTLRGAPVPENVEDIAEDRIILIDPEKLAEERDRIVAEFEEAIG